MMFKSSSQNYLPKHKYQLASIFCINPLTIIITLGTEIEKEQDFLKHIYAYNSYVFCQGNQLKSFPECRVLNIQREENLELPKMIVMNKDVEIFQLSGFKKIVRNIMNELFQVKILDQIRIIAIDSYKAKVQLINIGASSKQFDTNPQAVKTIYDLTHSDYQNQINTLSLLDNYTALFHISYFPSRNSILNCMDIQYQSIEWQQLSVGHNFMLNKIIKVHQKTFLNGSIDSEWVSSLKLYDTRVKGNVLNVLNMDDQVFQRLQTLWTAFGSILTNFNYISKSKRQFEIVGMMSLRAQTYNFPYILDLRKPNNILPIGYPDGKYINHIKCFEVIDNTIVAIERQYSNFMLKSTNLCFYQLQ